MCTIMSRVIDISFLSTRSRAPYSSASSPDSPPRCKLAADLSLSLKGNVQLSTTLTSTSPLPSSTPTPESLIALLKSSESSFAAQLSDAYSGLSDEQFKGLRRALPRTRTKVDWAKIVNYRLSKELGGGAQAGEA